MALLLCLFSIAQAQTGCIPHFDDFVGAQDARTGPAGDGGRSGRRGGDAEQDGKPPTDVDIVMLDEHTSASEPLAFLTYNASLAHNFVPYAAERREAVIQALAALDGPRFACLQGVWDAADREALQAGLAQTLPHQFYVDTTDREGRTEPACAAEEFMPLLDCVNTFCGEAVDFVDCVIDNCAPQFAALQESCATCVAANIAESIQEITNSCLAGAAVLGHEGRNGLLLLGSAALAATDYLLLDSHLLRRLVLHARVEEEEEALHLFCTHLTASTSELEYAGEFETWEAEQAAQIEQLTQFVLENAAGAHAVLMGDMGCGPAVSPGIVGELETNFDKFTDAGFAAPYVVQEAPLCTWCASNTLVETPDSRILDHILVLNLPDEAALVPSRMLDGLATIKVGEEEVESNLSDHFGVQLQRP